MNEQLLKIVATLIGGGDVARGLAEIEAAQAKLTGELEAGQEAAEAFGEATEATTAKTTDYLGILRTIHPQLGRLADGLLKAAKVSGDLAGQQIDLGKVTQAVTAGLKANAGALALLGAGGAVLFGISRIGAALKSIREEAERGAEAIKKQRDALNELASARADRGATIENITDRRFEGGVSADGARAMTSLAARVQARYPQLSPDAVNQAVALYGEEGMDVDALAHAAFSFGRGDLPVGPETKPHRRMTILDRVRTRNQGAFDVFRQREHTQAAESLQEARKQATSDSGPTFDLERVIREHLPADDAERILSMLREWPSAKALKDAQNSKKLAIKERIEFPEWVPLLGGLGFDTGAAPQPPKVGSGEHAVLQSMHGLLKAREEIRDLNNRVQSLQNRPPINIHNPRYYGADAAAQRARIRNGERTARDLE